MARAIDDTEVMTADEVARFLRIHRMTVYRLLKKGEFPGAFKRNKIWRFERSDVIAFAHKLE